jgi:predicted RNase H-like HicB family nuclease
MQYPIFVQNPTESHFTASVIGIPTCVAQGRTEAEALANAEGLLDEQLAKGKIVMVERPSANGNGSHDNPHPWMKFAGTWANDPDFDEFVAEMQRERELEEQA